MLQQWSKPHTLALSPEGLAYKSNAETVTLGDELSENASWETLLDLLETNLASLAAKQVRVIISNAYIRYAVMPWQEGIFSNDDWQALAERYMRTLYGNISETWQVKLFIPAYGKPVLVCATEQALVSRIESLLNQANKELQAIEPALISIINQYSQQLQQDNWLMLLEKQRVMLVEVNQGDIQQIDLVAPPKGDEIAEAVKLWTRTLRLNKVDNAIPLNVFGSTKDIQTLKQAGLNVHGLQQEENAENIEERFLLADL